MTANPVICEHNEESGVATLTFNRPDVLNAINAAMAEDFLAAVKSLGNKRRLRCVVITGAGRAFMAGGDVASLAGTPEQARDGINSLLVPLNDAILRLRNLEVPVIAGVKGAAAGAGFSLALMADLIVAEENARFLIAYNGIGAVPDCGGTWFLSNKLGAGRAAQMMLLGQQLTAAEAENWGLVTRVAPASSYDEVLAGVVQQVASGPTQAFGAFRKLMEQTSGRPLAQQLEAEHQAFLRAATTNDFREGVSAFMEKRPPAFAGN